MNQIFFSYSRSDSEFVGQMADELQARGVDVWVDTGEILAGEAWRHSIVEAIRNCKVFIIVLSPNSVASENVTKELTLAEQYDKRVLPLVIENVEIPPALDYQLAGLQHQTFAEGEYENNFERLVRALIATGIKVQPKSETSVDKLSDNLPDEEPINKIGFSKGPLISTSSKAIKTAPRENALKKIPIWLWISGAFVITLGLVVGIMSISNNDKREQPTATIETLIAVVPIEDTFTPTPSKTPTRTPTDEPTETLEPTEIPAIVLDPTETTPPTSTPTPSLTPYPTLTKDDFGVSMVLVSSGPFILGSIDGDSDEKPVTEIILDSFYIDQFEVTNASYKECVEQRKCQLPRELDSQTRFEYYDAREFANYPVIQVSWEDALNYCQWRGLRLPTELEWEKAARGPDGFKYPWGNEFEEGRANYCGGAKICPGEPDDGYADTAPVDAFQDGISPYGAYQMAGNVNEWTADWFGNNYYSTLIDGGENPLGPTSGQSRVLRGGSFFLNAEKLRSSNRGFNGPTKASYTDGFRCAADIP